ncbi:sugar ABC transporter ATP-binding protein [Microbacterium sp. E-13]|uniref:sugar ABC transporter ATP-binding protein n=1 Tax=Microbacterium sp. E-13 TaxID=3404048 RepID=UPI003CF2D90D
MTEPQLSQRAEAAPDILLRGVGLGKTYGTNRVLEGIDIEVRNHQVLGVVGENGAGKSTLLNLLSGVAAPDAGSIAVGGSEVSLSSYSDANRHGIFRVFQELALVPGVAVYENLFLTHEGRFRTFGLINHAEMKRRARAYLEEFEHGWIDVTRPVDSYPFSVRQILEIIKAFALADLLETPHPILLLDEPTAGLQADETEFFFRVVRQARERTGIVYVGHRLGELLDNSDRVLVIKDGRLVATGESSDMTEDELHHVMVGRARADHLYHENEQAPVDAGAEVLLAVEGLSIDRAFADVTFDVKAGEIVGLAGVIGSGKSDLGRAIFGISKADSGSVSLAGKRVRSIRDAVRAGMGYVPQDRAQEGALLPQSVTWNISLAQLPVGGAAASVIHPANEAAQATDLVERLRVKTSSVRAPVGSLSGGNQQKVILARWIVANPKVLVLDNPTRGVDVGAKEHIYGQLRALVAAGVGILLISDDLNELIMMSSRIHVMGGGRVRASIETPTDAKPTEVDLVAYMVA